MKLWRLWAKSIGEKSGSNDKEADSVAIIRTLIFLTYFMTNLFICAGVVRHWNDAPSSDISGKMVFFDTNLIKKRY